MKLIEANPKLEGTLADGYLTFQIPSGVLVRLRVHTNPQTVEAPGMPVWKTEGEFPHNVTLQPSVNVIGIWHGFITNSNIEPPYEIKKPGEPGWWGNEPGRTEVTE